MGSRRSKRPKERLPEELLPFCSADKTEHMERWYRGRSLGDIPKPFRALFAGGPGSGKSRAVKNILARAQDGKRPFTRVLLWHFDEETKEYDGVGAEFIQALPPLEFFHETRVVGEDADGEEIRKPHRTLMIIDDVDLTALPRDQKEALNRAFGYVSTHCGLSIAVCVQSFIEQIPKELRAMCNFYAIWRPNDLDSLNLLGRRVGLTKDRLLAAVEEHLKEPTDFLVADLTSGTPARYRRNLFEPIEI